VVKKCTRCASTWTLDVNLCAFCGGHAVDIAPLPPVDSGPVVKPPPQRPTPGRPLPQPAPRNIRDAFGTYE
jgi:hypothetical protein